MTKGFIDFICDIMKSYALQYKMTEKEVYYLFSRKNVFENFEDCVNLDKQELLIKIHEFIEER